MSHSLQQAFQELWRGDRAALNAKVIILTRKLAAAGAKLPEDVDWNAEVEELSHSADEAARAIGTSGTQENDSLGHALLLCAVTLELALEPTSEKLSTLRHLVYHSTVLEHNLELVILSAMNETAAAYSTWLELLKGWLPTFGESEALVHMPIDDLPTWGHVFQPNISHAGVEHIMTPLRVLLKADRAFVFDYLERIDDWGFVEHALLLSGAVSTFERWADALENSAPAFGASGDWTGSIVCMLLVKHAQVELLLPPATQLFGRSLGEPLWSCEMVIDELRKRVDGSALLRCWSVSTFSDYIAAKDSVPRKGDGRAEDWLSRLGQILEAIPSEVRSTRPIGKLPAGYPEWFVWYERGLEVHWHFQSSDHSTLPTAQVLALFEQVAQWHSDTSKAVRFHRTRIIYGRMEFSVGQLDLYLGVAVAAAKQPAVAWHALWLKTFPLREITEFGGHGEHESEDWRERSDASGLTELVLRLGISVAEALIHSPTLASDERVFEVHALLHTLQSSAMEMGSIEVLKVDVWTHALRYVLLLWGRARALSSDAGTGNQAFAAAPGERRLLEYLSTDSTELLIALTACANNGIAEQTLAAQLSDARIDLESALSEARKFSEMSRHKQRLPETSVALAERLCDVMVDR